MAHMVRLIFFTKQDIDTSLSKNLKFTLTQAVQAFV
jgi:hypothetical protein